MGGGRDLEEWAKHPIQVVKKMDFVLSPKMPSGEKHNNSKPVEVQDKQYFHHYI